MHIEQVKTGKHRCTDLLLIADPDRHMIDRYLDRGELFALYDGEELKSVCVVTAESETLCELKNLATVETARNRGYASALIRHILDICRNRFSVIQAGTGDFPKTIRFYEKCGFTPHSGFFHRSLSGTDLRGRHIVDRYDLPEAGTASGKKPACKNIVLTAQHECTRNRHAVGHHHVCCDIFSIRSCFSENAFPSFEGINCQTSKPPSFNQVCPAPGSGYKNTCLFRESHDRSDIALSSGNTFLLTDLNGAVYNQSPGISAGRIRHTRMADGHG